MIKEVYFEAEFWHPIQLDDNLLLEASGAFVRAWIGEDGPTVWAGLFKRFQDENDVWRTWPVQKIFEGGALDTYEDGKALIKREWEIEGIPRGVQRLVGEMMELAAMIISADSGAGSE